MSKFDPYEHLNVSLNPDGSLTRHATPPPVPTTLDEDSGVVAVSKDLPLNSQKKTWMRLFRPTKLPSNDNEVARIPIILYFHGGGWILFSAADPVVHERGTHFASQTPAICVSVNYRLAPEYRLPAQYEDAVEALLWIKKQALDPNGEKWLRDYGDFSRTYLYGCSNGANITFNLGLRTLDLDLEPLKIGGLVINQPMFSGVQRTRSELRFAADQLLPLPTLDLMWELALPKGTNRNHRYCNPMMNGPHRELLPRLYRCLVIGYGGDPMIDRQQEFVQMLVLNGVMVEARFDDVGFHGIDLVDPRRSGVVMNMVKEFIWSAPTK